MDRARIYIKVLMAICLSTLIGCGYGFQGSGSVLPPDVKRVYIPMAENNTSEPGLSLLLSEALRDQFERYGVLSVVSDSESADAVLRAKILKLRRETRTVTSNTDTALQLMTIMTVAAELRRVSGPVLWRNSGLSASKAFGTSSDVVVTSSAEFAGGNLGAGDLSALDTREISRGQEKEAIADLTEQVARRVYDEAVAPEF